MKTEKFKMQPYCITGVCSECGNRMELNDIITHFWAVTKYSYKCVNCGHTETSERKYPYLIYCYEREGND